MRVVGYFGEQHGEHLGCLAFGGRRVAVRGGGGGRVGLGGWEVEEEGR